jgi:hypothetical protein
MARSIPLALASLALIATAPAFAANVTLQDAKNLRTCIAMQTDDAVRDPGCQSMMRKENITKVDLQKMKSCESKQEAAADNPDCVEMVKKHPALARGHGMDEPGKSKH